MITCSGNLLWKLWDTIKLTYDHIFVVIVVEGIIFFMTISFLGKFAGRKGTMFYNNVFLFVGSITLGTIIEILLVGSLD